MFIYMYLLVLSSHRNSLMHGHGLFNSEVTHSLTHTKKLHILPKLCINYPYKKERFFSLNISQLSIMQTTALHNEGNRIHRLPFVTETLTVHNGD